MIGEKETAKDFNKNFTANTRYIITRYIILMKGGSTQFQDFKEE